MKPSNDHIFHTSYRGGRFTSMKLRRVLLEIEAMGGLCDVMVRPRQDYRTEPLHAFYRGRVVPGIAKFMRDAGHMGPHGGPITDKQVHYELKKMFLLKQTWNGERYIDIIPSTSKLTKSEFSDYVTLCVQWALDTLGLEIDPPRPGEEFSFAP